MMQLINSIRATCSSAALVLTLVACQPPATPPTAPKAIVVEVKRDGTIRLNGEPITLDEMEKRLAAIEPETTDVQLHPDSDAAYDDIDRAMEAVQRTGHIKKQGIISGS